MARIGIFSRASLAKVTHAHKGVEKAQQLLVVAHHVKTCQRLRSTNLVALTLQLVAVTVSAAMVQLIQNLIYLANPPVACLSARRRRHFCVPVCTMPAGQPVCYQSLWQAIFSIFLHRPLATLTALNGPCVYLKFCLRVSVCPCSSAPPVRLL